MALADTTIEDGLRRELAAHRKLLKRVLRLMPVAASIPELGINRVDYTDREWNEIVNARKAIAKATWST